MDGYTVDSVDGLGNDPRLFWGSFQPNGASNPDPTLFRYPRGLKFTVTYAATGIYTVAFPQGLGLPTQPGAILVSAQYATLATDYFDVGIIGETTLNTATRSFVIQASRGTTAQQVAATTGNRINFKIAFNNSTGA